MKHSVCVNDLVTYVRYPGDLIVGAVKNCSSGIGFDMQTDITLRNEDEGIYWLRGHILPGSDEGKALLANWTMERQAVQASGKNMTVSGWGGHAVIVTQGGGGGGGGGGAIFSQGCTGGGGAGNPGRAFFSAPAKAGAPAWVPPDDAWAVLISAINGIGIV